MVDITVTAFLRIATADILVRTTDSASTACPSWLWVDTLASNIRDIGSVPLTRGRNTGANDWYDNDDVYVTYADNGYYLYNRRYPNVGIAISISR